MYSTCFISLGLRVNRSHEYSHVRVLAVTRRECCEPFRALDRKEPSRGPTRTTVCIGTTKLSLSREVRRDGLPFSFNPRTSDTEFDILSAARYGLVTDYHLVYVILSRHGKYRELWVPSPLYR